jgi:DNA-binding NtrC family response regulator
LGTEKALSFEILRGNFLRELYQLFEDGYLFLPSLQERATDIPFLIGEMLQEISGKKVVPPTWVVDYFSVAMLENNLDQMFKILKNVWLKKPDMALWESKDLGVSPQSELFFKGLVPNVNGDPLLERRKLQQALLKNSGNRDFAAKELGLSRSDLLRSMMRLGVR